jgi:hypothetical protein
VPQRVESQLAEPTLLAYSRDRQLLVGSLAERAAPLGIEPERRIEGTGRVAQYVWSGGAMLRDILRSSPLNQTANLLQIPAGCVGNAEVLSHSANLDIDRNRNDRKVADLGAAWIHEETHPQRADLRTAQ